MIKKIIHSFLALTITAIMLSGLNVEAIDNNPYNDTNGVTRVSNPVNDNNDDNDMDWGWVGLIGLAGLFGLRRRDDRRS